MTARPEPPPVIPCYDKLAALLAESRPDTSEDDWRRAMLAAQTVGWEWAHILWHCAVLIKKGEGPRELREAVRHLPRSRKELR